MSFRRPAVDPVHLNRLVPVPGRLMAFSKYLKASDHLQQRCVMGATMRLHLQSGINNALAPLTSASRFTFQLP